MTGDGVYTNNSLYALEGAPPGPRAVRITAEERTSDGARTATIVDIEPFAVE